MEKKNILILAILAAFLVPLAGSIYMPNLGDIESEFGSSWLITLSVSGYLASQAVFQMFYGPLSDKIGRRKVYVPSLFIFIASNILCFLSWNEVSLVVFRIMQGGAVASGFTVGAAVISDVFKKKRRGGAMGMFMAVPLFAPPIGSFLGGSLGELFGWRSIFLFLAVLGGITAFLFFLHFPETLNKENTDEIEFSTALKFLLKPDFASVSFLGLGLFGTMYGFLVFFALILSNEYGFSTFYIGVAFALYGLANSLSAYIGGKLADRFSRKRIFLTGGFIAVFGTSLFALLLGQHVYFLIGSHLLFGIGIGAANPSLITYALETAPRSTGNASGIYNFIRASGASIVPFLGHFVIDNSSNLVFFSLCTFIILIGTLFASRLT